MLRQFLKAFFSIFGSGAQHAAKNRKKCQVLWPNFRRHSEIPRKIPNGENYRNPPLLLVVNKAVRSTPQKIGNNAKFYGRNSAAIPKFRKKFQTEKTIEIRRYHCPQVPLLLVVNKV